MDVPDNLLKESMCRKCIDKGAFVEVFQAISKVRKYGCYGQFFEKLYV